MPAQAINFADFMADPFISEIKDNPRWTVSTSNKMPVDIPYLEEFEQIRGASFANGNYPLVQLDKIRTLIVEQNQTPINNVAYLLQQAIDGFFVLDIEPDCPDDVKNRLLGLPYVYGETSMSGRGYHLVFKKPPVLPVKKPELFTAKPAIKHEDRYFEFLLNHYVTFTGAILPPMPHISPLPESELWNEFDRISENTSIMRTFDLENGQIPDLDEVPLGDLIADILTDEKVAYRKTSDDFGGDMSKYEFGVSGFYYKRLNSLLSTSAYQRHAYTPEERIRLLYEVIIRMIPYRKKHDEYREHMPWLMYTAKRVVTSVRDEK